MNKAKKENIVKATAKALGMTYKQLGEAIGYSEETIRTVASTGKVSESLQKAIELYLENIELKKHKTELETIASIIKKHS